MILYSRLGNPEAYTKRHSKVLRVPNFCEQKTELGMVEGSGKVYFIKDFISSSLGKTKFLVVIKVTKTLL